MVTLVAGVDSSTQSCKVMIRDADSGALVRSGVARHAAGTSIDARVWERAFAAAVKQAGGLSDVEAVSIAGQQHGMVTLDESGALVRDALLWHDTRSAGDAQELIEDLEGGRRSWALRTGSVPVASFTVTKLRWLARNEPENFKRVAAVCLPHDWLTWRILGAASIQDLATDRSEASGTGYFNPNDNEYDRDILKLASDGRDDLVLPRLVNNSEIVGMGYHEGSEFAVAPGCGDNAGAALGLQLREGQAIISVGTSGVVSVISPSPVADESGYVAGFASASNSYLPLVCTLNASRVLDGFANLLGLNHANFSKLALSAPAGAEGLVCVPYLEGERTPNLPTATGALHGITLSNLNPANIARAAVEGMLCGIAEGIHAIRRMGIEINSALLIGGGAQSEAVRRIAPTVLGLPVEVPEHGEYVADGAALQAAWSLRGGMNPPQWTPRLSSEFVGVHRPFIQERYSEISHAVFNRPLADKERS